MGWSVFCKHSAAANLRNENKKDKEKTLEKSGKGSKQSGIEATHDVNFESKRYMLNIINYNNNMHFAGPNEKYKLKSTYLPLHFGMCVGGFPFCAGLVSPLPFAFPPTVNL